jgi:hypothetical protein
MPHAAYTHAKARAQVTQIAFETSFRFDLGRDIFAARPPNRAALARPPASGDTRIGGETIWQ